jgi:hypothetical protein
MSKTIETIILTNILGLPFYDIDFDNIYVPSKCFGVFITIKRFLSKLTKYPRDIHGCIGYWTPKYTIMKRDDIMKKLIMVSKDAMNNDERRKYFNPIENDPLSIVEIDFMLLPTLLILNGLLPNKTEFHNSQYGLIVQNDSNNRATFLPKVMSDTISWNYISTELCKKANIIDESHIKYLGYKIKQLHITFFDILNSSRLEYVNFLLNSFVNETVKHARVNKFIPYIISKNKNKSASINNSDTIRNLSVIETLISASNFINVILDNDIIKLLKENIKYLDQQIKNDQHNQNDVNFQEQALLSLYITWNKLIKKDEWDINYNIILKLISNISNTERDFERGQTILTIIKYFDTLRNNIYDNFISNVIDLYELDYKNIKLSSITINEVFKLNWDSNVLAAIYKSSAKTFDTLQKRRLNTMIKQVITLYLKLFEKYNQSFETLETNYIVVIFQGIMSIMNSKIKMTNTIINQLKVIIFTCFLVLMKRWNKGYLYFIEGNARIDITGHFIDALSNT